MDEIAEVIAIDIENDKFDGDEVLEDPWEVLNICSSLITVVGDKQDQKQGSPKCCVALAHYSVKEYLLSDRISKGAAPQYGMQDTECHDAIARGCLTYLSQFQQPELAADNFLEVYKLAVYSARYWISHAQETGDRMSSTSQAVLRLLSVDNPAYFNWIRLCNPDAPWDWPDFQLGRENIPHPLYYAAHSGLKDVVKNLLENGADANSVRGGENGSPLNVASLEGHEQIVKVLLENGADPNVQDERHGYPLLSAVGEGHEQVVRLLLNNGADPNIHREDANPLFTAIQAGYEQIAKLLLDEDANPNAQVMYYHNPIYTASEEGFDKMVMLLLDKGADPDIEGGEHGTALQAASFRGHARVVKLLLDHGADPNAQAGQYGNALYIASERGHEEIVKLLLDSGADRDAWSGHYGSPLQAALERGHKDLVKLLLDKTD